ncbi:uncharacterized protein PV06_09347 [Exophiala oligosperma]|uniref:Uncharacterized protein n=1 Tax=Exophiala oligosperma TaxID=215243 RepID=A0A0D2ADX8_9EURO|nr:uncharacterized protein PV06_09347 [Exophiala oligosperma]KIW38376.1 hypothetical protein PV06_09347 [Exophiala oligosperma]
MTECKDERTAGVSEDQALNDTITWRPEFSTRRPINGICDDENIPWIDVRDALWQDLDADEGAGEQSGETKRTALQAFMVDEELPDTLLVDEDIEEFFSGASLELLRAKVWRGPVLLRKAWVAEGTRNRFEASPEWLTAHDLYHKLIKPRFLSAAARSNSAIQRDPDLDIERRLIFINDPDKWDVHALAGTASYYQVGALRNTFLKYLDFDPSMEVTMTTRGWPVFEFSLHLPYYAWRCSPAPNKDARLDTSGRPLRKFRNVSMLNGKSGNAYLYEGQISFVLAGIDEWTYVGYCFVDTYFDGDDGEGAYKYNEDFGNGLHTNPVMYGLADRIQTTHQARDFFLRVFNARLKPIMQEWKVVVKKLGKSIRDSHDPENDLCDQIGTHTTEETTEQHADKIRAELTWIENTWPVLSDSHDKLKATLSAWDNFTRFKPIFQNMNPEDRTCQSFNALQANFYQLTCLEKQMNSLASKWKNRETQLRCKHTRHDMDVGAQQRKLAETSHQLAEVTKKMSLTMVFSFPLALASAIFSMQPPVLPFPLVWESFLVALIVIGILCLAIYHFENYRGSCSKRCSDIATRLSLYCSQLPRMILPLKLPRRFARFRRDAENADTELPTREPASERPQQMGTPAFGNPAPSGR